jgi:hypothetical protein
MDVVESACALSYGPLSVWIQEYESFTFDERLASEEDFSPEMELLIRDMFQCEKLDVRDLVAICCYSRQNRQGCQVWVYTTRIILRGRLLGEVGTDWSQSKVDFSTVVHRIKSCEIIPVRSEADSAEEFSKVIGMFENDESSVYVQHYWRGPQPDTVCTKVIMERSCDKQGFKRGRSWMASDCVPESVPSTPKRERHRSCDGGAGA